jgi:hypothetical protein
LKNSHDVIIDSPVQIKPIQPEGSFNQGNSLFAILIAAIIIAIGIVVILIRKWPRYDRNENPVSKTYKILSRITTTTIKGVVNSANPPDEKKEGAPFSPI